MFCHFVQTVIAPIVCWCSHSRYQIKWAIWTLNFQSDTLLRKRSSKLHDCRSNKRACLVTAYWYAVLCQRIQKQIVNRNGGNLIFPFTENRIGVLSFPVLIFSIVNYDNDSLFKAILYTKVEVLPFGLVSGSKSALYMSSVSYDMFSCKLYLWECSTRSPIFERLW